MGHSAFDLSVQLVVGKNKKINEESKWHNSYKIYCFEKEILIRKQKSLGHHMKKNREVVHKKQRSKKNYSKNLLSRKSIHLDHNSSKIRLSSYPSHRNSMLIKDRKP